MKRQIFVAILALGICLGLIMNPFSSSAAIQGDLNAGMSLRDAIVKAKNEGRSPQQIMAEALQAVPDILAVVDAAIRAGVDTATVVAEAIRAGGDPLAVANAAMAAGASLGDVRNGLAAAGYPRPGEYVYRPPRPPFFRVGPPLPITGGVGAGGGGGRAASPTVP